MAECTAFISSHYDYRQSTRHQQAHENGELTITPMNTRHGKVVELAGCSAKRADGAEHLRNEAFTLVRKRPPTAGRHGKQKRARSPYAVGYCYDLMFLRQWLPAGGKEDIALTLYREYMEYPSKTISSLARIARPSNQCMTTE